MGDLAAWQDTDGQAELLGHVAAQFSNQETLSIFEFTRSKLADSLLHFVSAKAAVPISARLQAFVRHFSACSGAEDTLAGLARKLVGALSACQDFKTSQTCDGIGAGNLRYLSQPFKLRLSRGTPTASSSASSSNTTSAADVRATNSIAAGTIVLVEPLATVGSIRDFVANRSALPIARARTRTYTHSRAPMHARMRAQACVCFLRLIKQPRAGATDADNAAADSSNDESSERPVGNQASAASSSGRSRSWLQLQRLHDMTSPDKMLESRADDPDHDGSDDGNDLMVEEECADVSDRADELILDSKDAPDANELQAADPPRSLISCAVRSQLPKSDFQEEPDTPAPRFDSHRMWRFVEMSSRQRSGACTVCIPLPDFRRGLRQKAPVRKAQHLLRRRTTPANWVPRRPSLCDLSQQLRPSKLPMPQRLPRCTPLAPQRLCSAGRRSTQAQIPCSRVRWSFQ
jgi:hypothetical protein